MRVGKGLIIGAVVGLGGILAATGATLALLPQGPRRDALMGEDFFAIRREALALFPRGSRLSQAAERLIAIGFRCSGIPHKMANVNAESLICESHGRGYPASPAFNVTILARNGLLSDIEIWNMLDKADAETPEPVRSVPHDAGTPPDRGTRHAE